MEEANGDPSKATLGVNATDIQERDSRFPFSAGDNARRCCWPPIPYWTLTKNLTVTAKVASHRRIISQYLNGL
jgi:hypothetical protein